MEILFWGIFYDISMATESYYWQTKIMVIAEGILICTNCKMCHLTFYPIIRGYRAIVKGHYIHCPSSFLLPCTDTNSSANVDFLFNLKRDSFIEKSDIFLIEVSQKEKFITKNERKVNSTKLSECVNHVNEPYIRIVLGCCGC